MSKSLASRFRDNPRRAGDPVLDRLDLEVGSNTSVVDVGDHEGRYALPLALRTRWVTVVEPSAALGDLLSTEAKEANINNISIVNGLWEEIRREGAPKEGNSRKREPLKALREGF